ncbi:glycoside hydrolase family 2 protein [Niabella aquatica]
MFKICYILFALFFRGEIVSAQRNSVYNTEPVCINRDWAFSYFPENSEPVFSTLLNFDDKKWPAVALPHTWSVYETTGEKHPFIFNPSEQDDSYWWKGWGCYRKKVFFGSALKDKKIFLEFDGVQKYARIYINGKFVEDHKGGFTSFAVDITDKVSWNSENLLAITVSNQRNDPYRIPPMTAGNWNVYGGVYRNVRLVLKNKVFIPFQGNASHEGGAVITTSNESIKDAGLHLKTFVKNEYDIPRKCRLEIRITDPLGKLVKILRKEQVIPKGEMAVFVEKTILPKPYLWSPETPHLYKAELYVKVNGKVTDCYKSSFGVRWFTWNRNENALYLNDRKVHIKGTNRHQEYPWLGDAIPRFITLQDMLDIKVNLGHNFMRAAHYINDPYLYHLADSLGIIMVEEVPNIKSIDFSEEVQEQNVREMIRRDRNHPSILFWSMGNETSDAADSKWAIEEDSTRIIHLRKGENGGDFVTHTHKELDLEQLLRVTVRGWFDSADAPRNMNSTPVSGQAAGNETWQWKNAMIQNGSTRGLLGENCSAWLYADHGCDREYQNAPLKHVNAKGWVDAYREPKYIYYLTQALYTDQPVVFIHADIWRVRYLGQCRDVIVDSNCDEVELFVNGVSRGKQYPLNNAFPTVVFKDMLIVGGELKAVGKKNGRLHEHTVQMPGEAFSISLETRQNIISADRAGIAVVRALIKDKNGNSVTDANNTLTWSVLGQGRLIGASVYVSELEWNGSDSGAAYTVAPVSNLIRSTNVPGVITVAVSSPGLKSDTLNIRSVKMPLHLPDGIRIPELSDAGRERVTRHFFSENVSLASDIRTVVSDTFLQKTDGGYEEAVGLFIKKHNPGINDQDTVFQAIIKKISHSVSNQGGELVADDYNFFASRYNQYITLVKLIASRNFHVTYEGLLKEYYRHRLIFDDNQSIDFQEVFEMVKSAPVKMLELLVKPPSSMHLKGTIEREPLINSATVYDSLLTDAIAVLYPEIQAMDKTRYFRILTYLMKINPHVSLDTGLVIKNSNEASGVKVFVPGLDYLKSL